MQRKRSRALITPKLAPFSKLPVELITLVLLQLNLELNQLILYRMVCKTWRETIDSIIARQLSNTPWTISLLEYNRLILILGENYHSINGKKIWVGHGGKVSQRIYQSLTGVKMMARIEDGRKLSIKRRPEGFYGFNMRGWISCLPVYGSGVENITGLVRREIFDSVLLDDYESEAEEDEKLGDYDLSQYRNDLSDGEIFF